MGVAKGSLRKIKKTLFLIQEGRKGWAESKRIWVKH